MPAKVNLKEKLALIEDTWRHRLVGEVNDMHVKLVRLDGEFMWHSHEAEDELFLVIEGRLVIRFRDGDVALLPGELIVVPHGVEHMPVADPGTSVLLFEPAATVNTGGEVNERTHAPIRL